MTTINLIARLKAAVQGAEETAPTLKMDDGAEAWIRSYIAAEGDARHALHTEHASSRPLSEGYETVGLTGEFEFGRLVGRMPDLERRSNGDGGVDFTIPLLFTVDVKTARKAGNLIHEQGKKFCDIYILAEFDDDANRSLLVGWEWGDKLKRAPVRDFGHGVLNHYIPRGQLRPMSDFPLWRIWKP